MYACFCGCEKVDSLSLFPILPYKWTTILERIIAINFLQFSLQKVPCNIIPYKAVPHIYTSNKSSVLTTFPKMNSTVNCRNNLLFIVKC